MNKKFVMKNYGKVRVAAIVVIALSITISATSDIVQKGAELIAVFNNQDVSFVSGVFTVGVLLLLYSVVLETNDNE